MLKKFKVTNFKSFNEEFIFDLSKTKRYEFNSECIRNGITNNSIVYGHNGIGKSNLGLAIFDIIEHLTDKKKAERKYNFYLNAYNKSNVAEFYFEFLIRNRTVIYEYKKTDYKTLVSEKFTIDDEVYVELDKTNGNNQFTVHFKGSESLNKTIENSELSVIKYIKNNTVLEKNEESLVFYDFFGFIENMLYFRSLEDRFFLGFDNDIKVLTDDIIEKGNVEDFETFLNDANVQCKLSVETVLDQKVLTFDFGEKKIPMTEIASTGTNALMLFYFWYQSIRKNEVSFLFIDEFDAFYHHDLSALVVQKLKEVGVQFILTTHNTSILSNDLLRPDCYFLMYKDKITPLSDLTEKELRAAHNIEKMYKAGVFYNE